MTPRPHPRAPDGNGDYVIRAPRKTDAARKTLCGTFDIDRAIPDDMAMLLGLIDQGGPRRQ